MCSVDGLNGAAALARHPRPPVITRQVPSSWQSLQAHWLTMVCAFAAAVGLTLSCASQIARFIRWRLDYPKAFRWTLMVAWTLLAASNISRSPTTTGSTCCRTWTTSRLSARRALPLATDGWQMFQSPLYYIVSAPLYLLFSAMLSPEGVVKAARVVPLLCGLLQIEIVFRPRCCFPNRPGLQVAGTLIGGLCP